MVLTTNRYFIKKLNKLEIFFFEGDVSVSIYIEANFSPTVFLYSQLIYRFFPVFCSLNIVLFSSAYDSFRNL